jgi:hypothetical protein
MKEQDKWQNLILLLSFLTTAVILLSFASALMFGRLARMQYEQEIQNTN